MGTRVRAPAVACLLGLAISDIACMAVAPMVRAGPVAVRREVAVRSVVAPTETAAVSVVTPVVGVETSTLAPPECTARLRASFHLRPRAVVRSIGPELPAGTDVEVLGSSAVHRRFRQETWRGIEVHPVLSRVRVRPTGATGFAFVSPRELAPGCPLLRQILPNPQPTRERAGGDGDAQDRPTPRHGSAPARALARWELPFNPARDVVLSRFDADHNGSLETLIRAYGPHSSDAVIVLMRQGVRGPPGIVVDQERERDRTTYVYSDVIRSGRAVYVSMRNLEEGACRPFAEGEEEEWSHTLLRLHPDGWFVRAVQVESSSQGEPVQLLGDPDGGVIVEGMASHRRQRLRFDAATFSLVTEGPTMPPIELDLDYCGETREAPGS